MYRLSCNDRYRMVWLRERWRWWEAQGVACGLIQLARACIKKGFAFGSRDGLPQSTCTVMDGGTATVEGGENAVEKGTLEEGIVEEGTVPEVEWLSAYSTGDATITDMGSCVKRACVAPSSCVFVMRVGAAVAACVRQTRPSSPLDNSSSPSLEKSRALTAAVCCCKTFAIPGCLRPGAEFARMRKIEVDECAKPALRARAS